MRRFDYLIEKMEFQNQLVGEWSQYLCSEPPAGFDTSANHLLLCSESRSSPVNVEGNTDRYCNIWTGAEQTRVKNCNNRSFAMDARIRLDTLKSGCNSPLPCCGTDGMLFNYNRQKDIWDREESQEEKSALDSVELLDVEDDVQDEESWLYESPKKQVFVERSESALGWSRHVLDNPSPEMEAACRSLINKLDQSSNINFYRSPAVFQHGVGCADSSSISSSDNEVSTSHDSINTNYRLHDITDVHIMARMQEASLRRDYDSMPARRSPASSVMFPSCFNTSVENIDVFSLGNETEASSSFCWQPGLPSLSHCARLTPTSVAEQSCKSPKLTRLHQQVTQFKLLKLAQSQATSPGRMRSPLRTSLRSLQAVRNSRSLDIDDCQSADQIVYQPSGVSSVKNKAGCWAPSLSAAPMNHNSVRDSSDQKTTMKRLLRSQSLSPCRIPHPTKGYLSLHGRVFASPDRSTTVAWGRNMPSTQR